MIEQRRARQKEGSADGSGRLVVVGEPRRAGADLATALSGAGLTVERAPDPLAAIQLAREAADAVVVDDGVSWAAHFVQKLASNPRTVGIPVIVAARDFSPAVVHTRLGWGAREVLPAAAVPAIRHVAAALVRPRAADATTVRARAVLVATRSAECQVRYGYAVEDAGLRPDIARNAGQLAVKLRGAGFALALVEGEMVLRDRKLLQSLGATAARVCPVVLLAQPLALVAIGALTRGFSRMTVVPNDLPPEFALLAGERCVETPARAEKRRASRWLHMRSVAFKAASESYALRGVTYDISSGGVAVRTAAPLREGAEILFGFWRRPGEPMLRLKGTVTWRRSFDAPRGGRTRSGFGVELRDGDAAAMDLWEAECERVSRQATLGVTREEVRDGADLGRAAAWRR